MGNNASQVIYISVLNGWPWLREMCLREGRWEPGKQGHKLFPNPGSGKLQPTGQIWLTACFLEIKFHYKESHSHSLLSSVAAFTLFADLSGYNPQSPKHLLSGPWQKKFANPCPNPSHCLSKNTDPFPIRLFIPTKQSLSIYYTPGTILRI